MAKTTKRRKKNKKRESKQAFKNRQRLLKIIAVLGITFLTYLAYCFFTLPDINQAVARTRQPSTTVTAENGNEIITFGSVYSELVHLHELPSYVGEAIISTEDRRFYAHHGFDIIAFTRAMLTNLVHRRYVQGGSTLTQQVAKNLFLTPQKSIKRKTQELLLSFWLESKFSKEQIFTLYLNRVYLGAGTYGIEAASQKYFQKSSRDLNLKEAAMIAGMLKAPSRYNPIASLSGAEARTKIVLQNMVNNHIITPEEMEQAVNLPLGPEKYYKVEGARHFADWVYNEVNSYIGERDNDIYVYTTLDQHIQQKAEQILREAVKENQYRNVNQGAVVVLSKDGAVKAMVGGVNYAESQFNRAVQALRQPGSAFKPFVYLTALQRGWQPQDKIMDGPINIRGWRPENYDRKYHGEVTLTEALAKSYNAATVALSEQLPRRQIISNALKLGINSEIIDTPSLALGSFEVKVLDMATAYAVFANGGYPVWPYAIKEIYTRDGFQLYMREKTDSEPLFKPRHIRDLNEMLEAVIKKGTGRKAHLNITAYGKTGTTQDYRDAWFAGFAGDYITVVWLGNDDNSSMDGITGGGLPAKIWKKIMIEALKGED